MAGELGHQTVELGAMVRGAAEESYLALRELVEKSRAEAEARGKEGQQRSDTEKKIDLLKFVDRTRQRMLRLHVLAKWCQQVPLVHYCQQLASSLSSHETCFTQTADSLFFMHEGLQQARAPIFDVPFATEVLRTGSYRRLPKCIEEIGTQNTLFLDERRPTLKKLNTLVRAKLLETSLPKEISEVSVTDGIANLRVDGEFKVLLTLGYRGHFSLWRVLHMELLVGEKTGPIKLEETRRYALGDDIERRMANTDNPFMILYTVLHELCISLVMDTVIRQANVLRQGRWKDAIKSELISDSSATQSGNNAPVQLGQDGELDSSGFRIPGLKVNYWLDEKSSGSAEPDLSPFISFEAGKDMLIKCLHSSFILDPLTDKEADLSIDLSCIDVETLILKAIACNRHTRLLEIQRELRKNVQISQSPTDVVLKREEVHLGKKVDGRNFENSCTNEVLQVRAYGQSYIHLGINIRSGRLLFQSSKNILPPSALLESEEALNKGSLIASEVFVSLKTRSILHLFAATGRFLGLKVYSQSQVTLKIPKSVLYGSDFVVMGFPQCANAYYLLIQLDNELRPVFHLLETWIDGSNKSNADAATDANEAIRFNRININSMQIGENEYSVNLFDAEKVLQDMVNYNQSIEGRLRQSGNSELVPLIPSFSPSFSSVVDEVFGSDPSSSTVENQLLPPYSSPSTHLSSIQVDLEGVTGTAGLPELGRNFMYSDINTSEVTPSVTLNSNLLSNLNNAKGTNAFSSSVPAGISFMLSDCKSGQDLSSLRSPEGHGIVHGSKSLQLLSSDGQRVLGNISTAKPGGPSRKRSVSEFLLNIPSLQQSRISDGPTKRRKVPERMKDGVVFMAYSSSAQSGKPLTYGNVLTEENHCVTSATYASVLRHVIKHCSLCIKYAQLTTQMNSLGIPYAEEVGLWTSSSSNLWLRLPFPKEDSWKHVCLHLGNAARMSWDVRINDPYYSSLWKVHGGSTTTEWGVGVRIANTSEIDSHITFDDDGVILTYHTVEADSIQKLVSDLQRLSNARAFSCGMRRSIGIKVDDKLEEKVTSSETKLHPARKGSRHRLSEQMRRIFRIEAVGLMSLWFSHGAVPMVHFVVEWEAGNSGCTIHVSPDQLWPHTKFLEDFVNVGEVASFLDCIRLTAGPLLALSSAIRPAKMPVTVPTGYSSAPKQNNIPSQGAPANDSSSTTMQNVSVPLGPAITHLNNHNLQSSVLSATGRGGPGLVPSSSFPFDVSVVLRGPYWIRIIYRKIFSVDIRCFAGDQVWLQPATPPKGGPSVGGSLPCPQFRPFIMEHVAQGLNAFEPGFMSARHSGAQLKANANTASGSQQSAPAPNRFNGAHGVAISGPIPNVGKKVVPSFTRAGSAMVASSKFASGIAGAPAHFSPGTNLPVHMKGELNSAFTGLGDDGGYGGSWVPLAALKKVLRGILKYFGVLWLFSQFPELLKEILGSVLKENEGALLNLDQEQPALRFFVGGYVFAVSVQRLQLLLQVLNVKRFHHQQQQKQAQSPAQEELATSDINEICDYFSRRVACEPYDASRVASFITLLTLPISVIREFIKLFAWNKSQFEAHGEIASAQRARVELCLEKHQGSVPNDYAESSSSSKSNINHDRANHSVDFGLTFVLDHALIHRMSVSGGASWLPYCVSVRLRYTFGDNGHITFLAMEGSHGGKACWLQYEDWERCKQTVARAVETVNGSPAIGDTGQGRLRMVAEMVHKQLQLSLQQLRDGPLSAS